jgi:hypothetical protein
MWHFVFMPGAGHHHQSGAGCTGTPFLECNFIHDVSKIVETHFFGCVETQFFVCDETQFFVCSCNWTSKTGS